MPTETKSNSELDELAFRLYCERIAAGPVKRNAEAIALDAYQKAEAFIEIRDRVRSGELDTTEPEGPQLADVHAPNLKRTHPINLVSSTHGDLAKVARIHKWLEANPTPEEADELPPRLQKQFPDLEWDLPTINVARAVFPAYV